MISAKYKENEQFELQFVWKIPNGDFVRAIYTVQVVALDHFLARYVIQLTDLKAGRQEDEQGVARTPEQFSREYWTYANELVGRKAKVAFEVDDGAPIRLRVDTLTRQHRFFTRLDEPEVD